jgi:hypothetical protein
MADAIRLEFDSNIYSLDALTAAAYRFTRGAAKSRPQTGDSFAFSLRTAVSLAGNPYRLINCVRGSLTLLPTKGCASGLLRKQNPSAT